MDHSHEETHHEPIGYGVYVLIWMALVTFTGLTVATAGVDLKGWVASFGAFDFKGFDIVAVLMIASVKSFLVISYFMHIKYEDRLFKLMLLVVIMTLAVIMMLTFVDVTPRYTVME